MKMHANFALTTPQNITAKFPERRALRHLEVGKPGRLEAVAFAKILKPRQIASVLGSNGLGDRPQIVPFGIDRDQERNFGVGHF